MLELLFLLLPIAAAYGWYMGYRSFQKEKADKNNQMSRAYVTGVDYLLDNKMDKAVDLFLDILEKNDNEEDSQQSFFEAQLTLGNLFRSRGEVDRALRIHQSLNDSAEYSFEQKLLAKQQLAKDYLSVGFYDRAENLYITLVDEPEFAPNALEELTLIYARTKEWIKAINASEKLLKITPYFNAMPLAHYYCEYADEILKRDRSKSIALLKKALLVESKCVRASLILAEIAMQDPDNLQSYRIAIRYLENILYQDPAFIGEALSPLYTCYQKIGQLNHFEQFLLNAEQKSQSSKLKLTLANLIEEKEGKQVAQAHIYQNLTKTPDLQVFSRLIQYQIEQAESGRGKNSLILLHKMVEHQIEQVFDYKCRQCGFQSHRLYWCCPSCRHWETIKPTENILTQRSQHQ